MGIPNGCLKWLVWHREPQRFAFCLESPLPSSLLGRHGIPALGPVVSQEAVANWLCPVAREGCLHFSCWSPRAVFERSAASSVYLCAFIFACGSCYHAFCPYFVEQFFFAITLAFGGLAPSSSGSFWYTWCSWKKMMQSNARSKADGIACVFG